MSQVSCFSTVSFYKCANHEPLYTTLAPEFSVACQQNINLCQYLLSQIAYVCHSRKKIFSSLETTVSLLALVGYCLLLELKLSINIIKKNSDAQVKLFLIITIFQSIITHNFIHLQASRSNMMESLATYCCLMLFVVI